MTEKPAVAAPPRHPEQELKYLFFNPLAPVVVRWLEGRCLPDPEFPAGKVSSIYFDGPGWHCLEEKRNSDYYKTKVRLRWYSDFSSGRAGEEVYLEVKRREGGTRAKMRRRAPFSGPMLESLDLSAGELLSVDALLGPDGAGIARPLSPVFQVSYTRRRWIEPLSGCRVAVDYDISPPRVNLRRVPRANPFALGTAVVETKGPFSELPAALRPLAALGCRRESFSKYLACHDHLSGDGH